MNIENELIRAIVERRPKLTVSEMGELNTEILFTRAAKYDPRVLPFIFGNTATVTTYPSGKSVLNVDFKCYDSDIIPARIDYVEVDDDRWTIDRLFRTSAPLDRWIVSKNPDRIMKLLDEKSEYIRHTYEGLCGMGVHKMTDTSYAGYYIMKFNYTWLLDKEKVQNMRAQAELEARKVWRRLLGKANASDEVKVFAAYSYLNSVCSYDYEALDRNKPGKTRYTVYIPEAYFSYGAMIKHKAVCSGVSWAFKRMMDVAGIPCKVISGYLDKPNSEEHRHAWNMVYLGDGAWYHLDITHNLGDPGFSKGGFLLTDSECGKRHYWNRAENESANGDSKYMFNEINRHLSANKQAYRSAGADMGFLFPNFTV